MYLYFDTQVMMMQENIIDEIAKIKDVLPKKQQKLCHYLVMNYEQVGVMTVAELAEAAGVGTTTACVSVAASRSNLLLFSTI